MYTIAYPTWHLSSMYFLLLFRDCLADHVSYSEEPVLQCPFVDDNYTCGEVIQDREVKAVSLLISP